MPLINPIITTDEVVTITLKSDILEQLDAYTAFLNAQGSDATGDAVVQECVRHVCDKDKEFQAWMKSQIGEDGSKSAAFPRSVRVAEGTGGAQKVAIASHQAGSQVRKTRPKSTEEAA